MKRPVYYILIVLLFLSSCISEFIPKTTEDKAILVVEGLITDQPGSNTIKLSKSLPLGTRSTANPVKGCTVTLTDDLGSSISLSETTTGTYNAPAFFHGVIGRFYTLHIKTNDAYNNLTYESYPVEMEPVPAIDSVYYEKTTIAEINGISTQEGCQVYLDTHDPTNKCKFYRWEYSETWEFHLPYTLPTNRICWISANSTDVNIKNTSVLEEDKVTRFPLNYISNVSDRLSVKYSLLVNQYSLNEDEYNYWEKLQTFSEQVGGLYDIIPSSVPSNVYCVDNPNEKVLGYFSVSASSSKRIFIKDRFKGLVDQYTACIDDTITIADPPNLNISVWIIINSSIPYYNVITYSKGCADCSVRGTTTKPDYWDEGK